MNIHEIVDLVKTKLEIECIYPVSDRVWPDSLYYGRFRRNLIQIRVSDHEKSYPSGKVEITILVRDGMTEAEVGAAVDVAAQRLTEEEDRLARDEGIL